MCLPRRDIMRLHSKPVFMISLYLSLLLLTGSVLASQQAQPAGSPQKQAVQPTPLPPDVDASDPAVPVWMRPAGSVPPSKSTSSSTRQPAVNEDIVPTTPGQL